MASNRSVFNSSRGYYLREKYALTGLREGAFVWDEQNPGCVRDATLAEKYEAMMAEAAQRERDAEPLAPYEITGLVYRPVPGTEKAYKETRSLIRAAHEFVARSVAA